MISYMQTVLLVGPEFLQSPAVADWFRRRQHKCLITSRVSEVSDLPRSQDFDVVLSSCQLPDGTGFGLKVC
jgi:DNA-binding response OmpR family regulator